MNATLRKPVRSISGVEDAVEAMLDTTEELNLAMGSWYLERLAGRMFVVASVEAPDFSWGA